MNQFKNRATGGARAGGAQPHLRHVTVAEQEGSFTGAAPWTEGPAEEGSEPTSTAGEGLSRLAFSSRTIIPYAVVIGGISGAVMAVAVHFLLTELRPPQDLRVPGIAERVIATDQRLNAQEGVLRGVEVDLSRFIDTSAGLVNRADDQDARLAAVTQEIKTTQDSLAAANGTQSPVFGVAAAQLGQAVAAGRPFEAEWVNLFALSANDQQVRDMLMPLATMSTTGVGSPAELRQQLFDIAAATGVPHGSRIDSMTYGMMRLQTDFGIWMGYPSVDLIAGELLATADNRLAAGNVAGALAVLSQLPEPHAARLAPWLAEARRHEAAKTIANRMTAMARDRLSSRAQALAK
ncbi:MAG: hypothetical protein KKB63_00735 [Alphaproteobacteria bacterium]|nr:hypothetical protein [Alphaproteobacteria bacterium]